MGAVFSKAGPSRGKQPESGVIQVKLLELQREAIQFLSLGDDLCQKCGSVMDKEKAEMRGELCPDDFTSDSQMRYDTVSIGSYKIVKSRLSCALCRLITEVLSKDVQILRRLEQFDGENLWLGMNRWRWPWEIEIGFMKESLTFVNLMSSIDKTCLSRQRSPESVAETKATMHNELILPVQGGQQISPLLIRNWLQVCEHGHGHNCNLQKQTSQRPPTIKLLLIDVIDECIVAGQSDFRYCALSYVWGHVSMFQSTMANISKLQQPGGIRSPDVMLPNTIQDSMTVVAAIGERYLWVDSLCIVQDDATQKKQNIMQMDIIYKEALLTIVALSGQDANSLLPGVRPYSRPPQAAAMIGNVSAIATPPMLLDALRISKYDSRGWTFQERLLAKRCLYFSSNWVYFNCRSTTLAELRQSRSFPRGRFLNVRSTGSLNPLATITSARHDHDRVEIFKKYYSLVEMYQERILSNPADILNAFAGIMADFQQRNGTMFACGLPEYELDRALLWRPDGILKRRRKDVSPSSDTARLCYPSWSWAGWVGKVQWIDEASGNYGYTIGTKPELNSVIRRFYFGPHGKPRATQRHSDSVTSSASTENTAYTMDTNPKLYVLSFTACTVSCRGFTVRAVVKNDISIREFDALNIYDTEGWRCGRMFEKKPPNFVDDESSSFDFILLSTSPSRDLSDDHWSYITHLDPRLQEVYNTSRFRSDEGIVNAMLVKWTGDFAERVALCQMHSDVFSDPHRKTKQISLI
jgi:hypothetical protein